SPMKWTWIIVSLSALSAACSSSSGGAGGSSASSTSASSGSHASSSSGAGGASASSSSSGAGGAATCAACVTIAKLPAGSKPYGIFVDDMNVYWTNFGTGEVMQAKLDGSSKVTLTTGEKAPVAVQADGGLVYWVSYSEVGVLRAAPVGGGAVVDIS